MSRLWTLSVAILAFVVACSNATDTATELPPLELPLRGRVVFGTADSIVAVNVDGTDGRRVSPIHEFPDCPSLSPDNRSIAYTAQTPGDPYTSTLYVIDANGTNRTVLAEKKSHECPIWSPDSKRVAVVEINADRSNFSVRVFSREGVEEAQFAGSSLAGFSRAGDRLIYDVSTPNGGDIYSIKVDGSDPVRLASGFRPSVARGADLIAYECIAAGQVLINGLCLMNGDGSGQRKVLDDNVHKPVISPNGQLIAYDCAHYLCLATAEGIKVATSPLQASFAVNASWRGDSGALAYECAHYSPDYYSDICTVNADGTGFRNITNDAKGDWYPSLALPATATTP